MKLDKETSLLYVLWDWLKVFAVAIVIAIFIKTFIVDLTIVKGHSMDNTLAEDDILFVDKVTNNFCKYDYGDIVVLKSPDVEKNPKKEFYIKRIIGLPGDTVNIFGGSVYINGEKISEDYINSDITYKGYGGDEFVLDNDEYFVMGDNRMLNASNDSRNFGAIKGDNLVGRAFFRAYPFKRLGKINSK